MRDNWPLESMDVRPFALEQANFFPMLNNFLQRTNITTRRNVNSVIAIAVDLKF